MRANNSILAAAVLITFGGCAVVSAPIKNRPQMVATPENGRLIVSNRAADAVGDVVPVYISVANGTDVPRAVVPSQIFAINEAGQRVAPLPPGEAARQAGGAGQLKAVLTSAAVGGVGLGAIGAGLGAAGGAAFGDPGAGAILGGVIGGARGMLGGAARAQRKVESQANQQIQALALHPADVRSKFTISGYVFFPKATYRNLQLLLVDRETGDTEVFTAPWR